IQVHVWEDLWLGRVPLHSLVDFVLVYLQHLTVRDLIDLSTGEWDLRQIQQLVPVPLIDQIKAIPIGTFIQLRIKKVWSEDKSGHVMVKSAYNYLCQENFGVFEHKSKWMSLWKLRCPSHARHILWVLAHNKTLVRASLVRRGMHIIDICPLCHTTAETIDHAFKDCPKVSNVWDLCKQWWGIHITYNHVGIQWLMDHASLHPPHRSCLAGCLFPFILWQLWLARNRVVLHNDTWLESSILSTAYHK
ncbi:hypothetical protein MKW98_029014, partial [Papaver atlanticum]